MLMINTRFFPVGWICVVVILLLCFVVCNYSTTFDSPLFELNQDTPDNDIQDTDLGHVEDFILEYVMKALMAREGFSSRPYLDSDGVYRAGYGIVYTQCEIDAGLLCDRQYGYAKAMRRLNRIITRLSKSHYELDHLEYHQKAALSLFIYNVGFGAFIRSNVYDEVKAGSDPQSLLKWVHVNGQRSTHLINARRFEYRLYNLFL